MKLIAKFISGAPAVAAATMMSAGYQNQSWAAPADIAKAPLTTSSATSVKANLMFILDDSGSMSWDFMPDQLLFTQGVSGLNKHCRTSGAGGSGASFTTGSFDDACCHGMPGPNRACVGINVDANKRMHPPLMAAAFNGTAYNPNTLYSPPVGANGASAYPSQTSTNTTDWTQVANDGFDQSTSKINLLTGFPDLLWCQSTTSPDSSCIRNKNYVLPGKISGTTYGVARITTAFGTNQKMAVGSPDAATTETRSVGPHYYTINTNEYCSSIELRVCAIQAGPTPDMSFPASVRWCKTASSASSKTPGSGQCQAVMTSTYSYARYPSRYGSAGDFPGSFDRVDIIPTITSYPKSAGRTDCAGATCSYSEEMTNFANWWAYYRTRMQLMKTSTSRAFQPVGNNYRLGYVTLNKNAASDFLNINTFEGTHKENWFAKLFAAKPNLGTELRKVLSDVGKLFAGRLTSSSDTTDSVAITEPMEYSCQKNFTILSTDGYWNGDEGSKLDGSSIGDQDSTLAAPKKDRLAQPNSLADTAYYFYNTDLRHNDGSNPAFCTNLSNGQDLCGNSSNPLVTPHEKQNMQVFTIGLGAPGNMQYLQNYLAATAGDYYAIKHGLAADPSNGICAWQASGICTWPKPVFNQPSTIDDLWHAAVNTDGLYFSAKDPDSLYAGLRAALSAIDAKNGATAAATTSNPNVTSGDNQIFLSSYRTGDWTGDIKSHRIDLTTGGVNTNVSDWSAKAWLDANGNSRTIHMFSASSATKLKAFSWATLSSSEKAYFQKPYISSGPNPLSQFCSSGAYCLTSAIQDAAAGEPLVRFIAGERANEGGLSELDKYFRVRASILGDIVSSEGAFVRVPRLGYADSGYSTHQAALAGRPGMLYVGANDGVLHAIDAATGAERWAYVPTEVLPKLYTLADKEYPTKHEYFVNASPVIADIKIGSTWRTILVSGLGQGGRAYFALDVTDPLNPKALWEFKDNNLGYTLGRAEIGKLADGTWSVFLPSGYNNVSPGDGKGRVFVLNAATGALNSTATVSNNSGSTTTPSNLGHIRAWKNLSFSDATVMRVYGGDTDGNVWRFDVNNNVGAPGADAQLLATLKSALNVAQPITSRPELGMVAGTHVMVYVGTGRYLGVPDIADAKIGSIYGIKDRMNDLSYGNPRVSVPSFVNQTLGTTNTCPPNTEGLCTPGDLMRVTVNAQPVDLAARGGWYVDLLVNGERVHTDMRLVRGTLAVNSSIPDAAGVCKAGGSGWINYIDYANGSTIGAFLGNAIPTAPTVTLVGSDLWDYTVTPGVGSGLKQTPPPNDDPPTPARRLRWRNLAQ